MTYQIETTMTKEERNCAFQYCKIQNSIFNRSKIIEDKNELTLAEAKELWNKYYEDAAKFIKDGNSVEMVIWINMSDKNSYGDTLQYISTDAESDGRIIWVVEKKYFKTY